jgi:hypothetical protein
MAFEQEAYIGTLNFHWSVPQPTSPTPSLISETVWLEASRVVYEGEIVLGASAWEEMVEAPALMEAAGANASLSVSGGRMNEAEPQSIDAPNRVAITPGSLREPSFSPSWEATLDNVLSVTRSIDIVDLGNRELELLGYPQAPLLPTN